MGGIAQNILWAFKGSRLEVLETVSISMIFYLAVLATIRRIMCF